MFDLPFDFFSLAIAIIGLIVARKAFDQIAVLRALDEMGPGSMLVEDRPFRVDLE